jgi:predicted Rossmann fold flavoprotein
MNQQLDILIIGGGAAGFFAAIRAGELNTDARILILERGKEVLTKVKVSGGGRCNVTHACFIPRDLSGHYPRGEKELLGPFHQFACGDMLDWLDKHGVETKIEEDGRIFPTTDDSQTIIDCFLNTARQLGIQVLTRQRAEEIIAPSQPGEPWKVRTPSQTFEARRLMIATGSNTKIWQLLEKLGHRIIQPVPSLFTFNIKDDRIKKLPGISMPQARVKVLSTKLESSGPILITHWGLSGPAILKLSAWGARELHKTKYQFRIQVNWPGLDLDHISETILRTQKDWAKKQIQKQPLFQIPGRLWHSLCLASHIPEYQRWADLNKKQRQELTRQVGACEFEVNGKSTFKEEFVTAGGIDLKEVNFKTFESKLLPGLFFAGEVLNIDAITGGFNFQAAWTGSWIAGRKMAEGVSTSKT